MIAETPIVPSEELAVIRAFHGAVLADCIEFVKDVPLNEFWGGINIVQMDNIIYGSATMEEVIHRAQQTFMFSVIESREGGAWAVDWMLENLHAISTYLSDGIQESEYSHPEAIIERAGNRYTNEFLRCLNIVERIERRVYCEIGTVVELGAGLGHLARCLVLATNHIRRYVIIDIPDTLAFSYCFLKKNFPDARVTLVDSNQPIPYADWGSQGLEFVFVPICYADAVAHIEPDLFVNTCSMGEMRNETVKFWMDYIQTKLKPRFSFMLNRFLNTLTPKLSWRQHENQCQQHYDRHWKILHWELEPVYMTCPYVDTRISRVVEIVAERKTGIYTEETNVVAAAMESVAMMDFWRHKAEGHVMGQRDNVMRVDCGMSGALFKLWNVLRLRPGHPRALEILRYYLTTLRRSEYPFEEEFFYDPDFVK